MYTLIRSYFENRNQRMSLSHKLSQSNISNWGTIKYMVYRKDQYLYPCSFYSVLMTYLKYQTFENLKINLKIILFADDTSVVISNPNVSDLEQNLIWVFKRMNEWFNANLLSLNFTKTYLCNLNLKILLLQ